LGARPVRGEARRDLILDAAIAVLGQEGLSALTHRRVAAEAGLPLAATTYWFSSKDELLVSAFRRAADKDIARVRSVAAAAEGKDVADALADVLGAEVSDGRTALVACFTMWVEAARRPELRELATAWTEAYEDVIAELLRAAGSREPRVDARLLTAALDGLLLGLLAHGGVTVDAREELRPQLRRLVGALTARRRG
jgi:TetR/AcrR family transcriptional regulator, regulator of biofilm formation and stress response